MRTGCDTRHERALRVRGWGRGRWRGRRRSAPRSIPVVVLGEFRYGIATSRHRAAYEAWLGDHLSAFEVLAVTEDTAVAYAGLRVALRKAGRPIPANDAWIAALSLQHRLPVLSRDRHFRDLPGVQSQGW